MITVCAGSDSRWRSECPSPFSGARTAGAALPLGQEIFDALGAPDKQLLWIEESNHRFYAYNHFGQYPEPLLDWFAKHL